jgi:chromosome segregation ATPase
MTDPIARAKALLASYARYEIGEHDWVLPPLDCLRALVAEAERLLRRSARLEDRGSRFADSIVRSSAEHAEVMIEANSRIAELERERDEALAEIERLTGYRFDGSSVDKDRIRALEAEVAAKDVMLANLDSSSASQIQRLQTENAELRREIDLLRNPPCAHDSLVRGECVFCGEWVNRR